MLPSMSAPRRKEKSLKDGMLYFPPFEQGSIWTNKQIFSLYSFFSVDENLITLLSYILLFSTDFAEEGVDQNEIVNSQETMIRMLQRYVFGKYPRNYAINLFAKVLNCVSDLQELCTIKKQRIMVADPKKLMEEEQETDQEKLWKIKKFIFNFIKIV